MSAARRAAPLNPASFRKALHAWYRRSHRDLPWRSTRDPYHIWLSEVMLQQTRVETALSYYGDFLQRFPTIESLASAPEARVLAAWSGLGYYARARNLRRAADILVREHGARFPRDFDAVHALPGLGRSSAGSILSIAFDDPWPVLDGNVARVLQRVHASGRGDLAARALWEHAEALLPSRGGGVHSQAMMELGARVCVPGRPDCGRCPVSRWCEARAVGIQDEVPAPRARPAVRAAEAHAAIAWRGNAIVLARHGGDRLLRGMVGIPTAEDRGALLTRLGAGARLLQELEPIKHSVMDRRITMQVCEVRLPARSKLGAGLLASEPEAIFEQPLDGASKKILLRRLRR